MHNVRIKDFGNGKKQFTIYAEPIISTTDGLEKDLKKYESLMNNDIFTEEQRNLFKKMYKNILGELDKRNSLKDNEEELEGKDLEFFLECKENARLHSQLNNFKRAKNKIYDYARSNQWEYFLTFTFNKDKVDRSNYDECKKKLTKWLNNISIRFCGGNLKYLVVPELHADLINWHFHGLLANCDGIIFEPSGHIDNQGRTIYNLPQYKLGFTTATKVTSSEKASGYICKYVTKQQDLKLKGKRRYLISNNLDKPLEEKLYTSYLDDYVANIKYIVWHQDKEYEILGISKKMTIIEVDERNN